MPQALEAPPTVPTAPPTPHGPRLTGSSSGFTSPASPGATRRSTTQAGTFLLLRPGVTVPVKTTFLKFKMKSFVIPGPGTFFLSFNC